MNIWIVDDNISFAYNLKRDILRSLSIVFQEKENKVEVYHNAQEFEDALQDLKKSPSKKPHLVFLDIEMPGKDGLTLYLEILSHKKIDPQVITFCSAMSYGSFQDFFENQRLPLPSFVPKSQVSAQLDSLLAKAFPTPPKKQKPLSFIEKKLKDTFEKNIKNLDTLYYEGLDKTFSSKVHEILKTILPLLQPMGHKAWVEPCRKMIHLIDQEKMTVTKLKKDLRELLAEIKTIK